MAAKDNRSLLTSNRGGLLQDLTERVRLIGRLMMDRRVNFLLKLLPIGTLVYLFVPTDLIPLIPIDDAAVIWLGTYLFVEMCPPDVVQEHIGDIQRIQDATAALDHNAAPAAPSASPQDAPPPRDVVDGEFREVDEA